MPVDRSDAQKAREIQDKPVYRRNCSICVRSFYASLVGPCPEREGRQVCMYCCRMYEADIYYCAAAERDIDIPSTDEGRCSFCPIVPIPPHGDLIERDKAVRDLRMDYAYAAARIVSLQPIIVPAEEAPAEDINVPGTYDLLYEEGGYNSNGV